jgi:O-succinylbenzoic acid--CoA ligase
VIQGWAEERPDELALIRGGQAWTSRELQQRVEAYAAWLQRTTDPDRPIAFVAHPEPWVVALIWAAISIGKVVLPLHPRWPEAERAALLLRLPPTTFLSADPDPPPAQPKELPVPDTAPLAWFGTSGSTGQPKAVELTRGAFWASAAAYQDRIPDRPGDRWWLGLPLSHVGGFSILIRAASGRRPVVLAPAFDPETFSAQLEAHGATLVSLVPTMVRRLLPRRPPPVLRVVLLGGASASPELLDEARALGWPIHTTYGLTEAAAMVTLQGPGERGHDAGRPLAGNRIEVRQGRIHVAGPTLLRRYVGDGAPPTPLEEGWLDTGDLGEIDEAGRLWVHARRQDLILRGGENVYPAEVERVLEQAPGVRAACVFGVEDPEWGQRVVCALSVEPGFLGRGLALWLEGRLAKFKWPVEVALLQTWPELSLGKPDRAAIRRIAEGQRVPLAEAVSPAAALD